MITVTGNDGRFAFRNVVPGQYMIEASRSGYVLGAGRRACVLRLRSESSGTDQSYTIVQQLGPGQVLSGLALC